MRIARQSRQRPYHHHPPRPCLFDHPLETLTTGHRMATTTASVSSQQQYHRGGRAPFLGAPATEISAPRTPEEPLPHWPNFVSPTTSGTLSTSLQQPLLYGNHNNTMVMTTTNGTAQPKRLRDAPGATVPAAAPFNAHTWHGPPPPVIIPHESLTKKRRHANYVPVREVPKTLISSMGSLAARNQQHHTTTMRRQLSGSNLVDYLGRTGTGHTNTSSNEAMDVEDSYTERPRSMSF